MKIVFVDPVRRRRRRRLLVATPILVCFLGLGYSLLGAGQENIASAVLSSTPQRDSPRAPTDRVSPAMADEDLARERIEKKAPSQPLSTTAKTCDDPRVLVDRSHALPPDYAPEDLVSLPDHGVTTLGGRRLLLRREAADHLRSLMMDAATDGEELVVASAFRSYADQQSSYGRLRSVYGSGANALSAIPGHSQHQLGTAVDFTNAAASYQVRRRFGHTSASGWLQDHAAEYGFVLAYPRDAGDTGYEYEPWHYRYIGVENAGRLEQSDLELQGFLVREGILPHC